MHAASSENACVSSDSTVESIPVLLVEDDPGWRQAVEALLAVHPRFRLVAAVDCFEEAMAAFDAYQPKMALLDWQIVGEQDGLAVGEALMARGLNPNAMIVVSGSPPASIPPHPFRFVAKTRIASDLLQSMDECLLEVNG
jgi:DNA-binding NarL/FixJ family response regulator